MRRHDGGTTRQVDVDPAGILFRRVLEVEFLADLLDARFDLLDMARGVVALSDDTEPPSLSPSAIAFLLWVIGGWVFC